MEVSRPRLRQSPLRQASRPDWQYSAAGRLTLWRWQSLSYGHMLSGDWLGEITECLASNWEIRGELFGGGQCSPSKRLGGRINAPSAL